MLSSADIRLQTNSISTLPSESSPTAPAARRAVNIYLGMICSALKQCGELNATANLVEKLSHEKRSLLPRVQPFWILHLVESAGPR